MTHLIKKLTLSAIALLMTFSAQAQLNTLPVKTINGREYYYYRVKKQETLYSLSHRFGISREDFVRYNPTADDGLKENQELLFPVALASKPAESKTKPQSRPEIRQSASPSTLSTHIVARGETAYGVSAAHGMTLEQFYTLNPSTRDGLREGQQVRVLVKGVASSTAAAGRHTIAPHETLYKIARDHDITITQLLLANPDLDENHYEAGQVIMVPAATLKENVVAEVSHQQPAVTQPVAEEPVAEVPAWPVADKPSPEALNDHPIVIAVALPFMAHESNRPKSAISATEFYKGLLVAVDSLGNQGRPIKILAYDTKGTVEGAKSVLNDPHLSSADIIIGPDKPDQFQLFAQYAKEHGINIMNLFVVKDEAYRQNPYVMHANITHTDMYNKATDYYLKSSPKAMIVVLKRKDGQTDKKEFIDMLRAKASRDGRKLVELEFTGTLTAGNLEALPEAADIAFIPISSKSDELSRILPAIESFKKDKAESEIRLFGYPEWLVIRNDLLDKMYAVDTHLFSRFYSVADDYETNALDSSFVRWYGSPMASTVPRQGAYGFDTGVFLIKALNANNGDFNQYTPVYDGVQNAFNFIRIPGGGRINNELFILRYTPSKTITKQGI